jgi:hypothetical protein
MMNNIMNFYLFKKHKKNNNNQTNPHTLNANNYTIDPIINMYFKYFKKKTFLFLKLKSKSSL